MSDPLHNYNPKNFWKRPEGKTGIVFLAGLLIGGGLFFVKALPTLVAIASNTLSLVVLLMGIAAVVYMAIDSKMRNLVFYMYKSLMRFITGIFVQIDPIGILETYIADLKANLSKMSTQIGNLRGEMRKLKTIILSNESQIKTNLAMANKAKEVENQNIMILKTRKAGRLKESNMKLSDLYTKMEVLYRVLSKMYENSEVLMEDVKDQVQVKKIERDAIHASHSVMKSARSIISGNSDKREMFDMALESIAEDVGTKIGEMEHFMELSGNFMDSIDLQNGIFEEEGLKMLEQWEKEGVSFLLGDEKQNLVDLAEGSNELDIDAPLPKPKKKDGNQYSDLFDF